MRAAILAVGSELLRLRRADGNGDWLQARLEEIGIETVMRLAVEDEIERIAALVRAATAGSELALVTGGLGPTGDDRTREALALAFDVPLERDAERVEAIARRLAARGIALTPAQARQADRPRGASWIANPRGTAPGLFVPCGEIGLYALPGVPAEMIAMFRESILPRLLDRVRPALRRRSFLVAGLAESAVDERLRELYDVPGVDLTVLAEPDGVGVYLRCRAESGAGAEACLDGLEGRVRERLGPALVGVGDASLAAAVGRLLAARHQTLGTAESCTGGLLAATITAVAGASAWYRGGIVAYSDDLKRELARVRPATIAEHGAVSEAVARELALAACERTGADVGIGVTGIAGPAGGSAVKPVGRVHLALRFEGEIHHARHDFGGDRQTVQRRAVAAALDCLRRRLLEGAR